MNVMIDLETLDSIPTANIIAIGAVRFDRNGASTVFYTAVEWTSGRDVGLTASQDTIDWWSAQGEEARHVFEDESRKPIGEALALLTAFLRPSEKVWGNGASFDNVILANAYRAIGEVPPWDYWNDRCYRTVKSLISEKHVHTGVKHNALHDAWSQAVHLSTYGKEFIK